jgi:ABC-type nitrate/sulfonate/bicarbonate transport system permease component
VSTTARLGHALATAAPIGLVLAGWEALTRGGLIRTQVLPTFSSVCAAAADLVVSGELEGHLAVSLGRALGGLALSVAVGTLLGFGMAANHHVRRFFDPLLGLLYPLPKTALVPLTMVWLGLTNQAAVLVIFLACLLPIVINTYHGVQGVERVLVWSARSLGTRRRRLFARVVVPAAMPSIMNGVRIAVPIAFIVVISVELVASRAGVGNLINGYGSMGVYDYMFAAVLSFVAVAFVADRCVVGLGRRLLRWAEDGQAR